MFTSLKNSKKGFTLIELLVVIAIIGILSSVVLASLSTARQKSRDAKRISDLGQVQLALELFFDRTQSYPSTSPTMCGAAGLTVCAGTGPGVTGSDDAIVGLADIKQAFLPKAPTPAGGGGASVAYYYYGMDGATTPAECTAATQTCVSYLLGTTLERTDNTVLASDADQTLATSLFWGDSQDCGVTPGTTGEKCYDIKP
jgi:prepilin-type N-terminal cleavage/methylation domain-containing protein